MTMKKADKRRQDAVERLAGIYGRDLPAALNTKRKRTIAIRQIEKWIREEMTCLSPADRMVVANVFHIDPYQQWLMLATIARDGGHDGYRTRFLSAGPLLSPAPRRSRKSLPR